MVKYITKEELISFEQEISDLFLDKKIRNPIHLNGGCEEQLIAIFKMIKDEDWVFATHRNHYHALLKGISKKELKQIIVDGNSMHVYSKKYRFFTSSIVGGCLSIALGIAIAIKRKKQNNKVIIFIGDMAAETGSFHECTKYAKRHNLPIIFIVEDNGVSVDTPTQTVWGDSKSIGKKIKYKYKRVWPHVGCGEWVTF